MKRETLRAGAVAAAVLVFVAGCRDHTQPVGPPTDPGTAPRAQVAPAARGSAPDRAAIAREVPGFGGIFFDEAGRPTVYLTDTGRRAAVERELAAFLADHGFQPSDLQVRQGQYDFLQLDAWLDDIWRDALAVDGAVFAAVSEPDNRVLIGVEDISLAGPIRTLATARGVPGEAVAFEEAEPILPVQTLQSKVDPIVGGLQINFPGFLCTLGFNALHGAQESWITNSHCTDQQGSTTGTQYRQPLSSVDPTVMGIEVDDPPYLPGGMCPSGRVCRFSDAARVRREGEPTRTFARGMIARLQSTFSASSPIVGHFEIKGKLEQPAPGSNCPVVGTPIHKVGRTTGWTHGSVSTSCGHANVAFTSITLLFQTFVSTSSGGVDSGDSGSPVFFRHGTGADPDVTLHGILWGGSGSTTFVYSPMVNIEVELGALTVDAGDSPPPPPPNEPPTVTWVHPTNGQTVGGVIPIEIEATDDSDSGAALTVEWRVITPSARGPGTPGPWQPASHAGDDLFTANWEAADGNYTLEARATDSQGATSAIASIGVNVDNSTGDPDPPPPPPNQPPTVAWVHPTNGQTVGGVIPIEIQAVDDHDSGPGLTVEWRVITPGSRGGSTTGPWQPAGHAGGDLYTSTWQAADGNYTLEARGTDSQSATSSIASIGVTVDNSVGDPDPPPPPESRMYVAAIDFAHQPSGRGPGTLSTTVTIRWDSTEPGSAHPGDAAAAGATVSMTLVRPNGTSTFTGTTNGAGQVTFAQSQAVSGEYTATVTNVSHPDHAYDAALDTENPKSFVVN